MRLSEPIEKLGFFWFSEEAENRIPGILRISESGKVTLEVIYFSDPIQIGALLVDGLEYRGIKRIVGIIENELITLDGCGGYTDRKESLSGGVSKSTIRADRAFKGFHYEVGEEITFSKLIFSVEGLDEWLSISGFQKPF